MLTSTNRALSSFSNEAALQRNNAVAEEDYMMDLNQSRTVGAYLDTFTLDNHHIKSMRVSGSGIKLVSPLRG